MITITTAGGVSPATGLGAYGVNADGAGSQIKLGSATITTSSEGATGLFASDRASSSAAGTITATGTLNVQTKSASAAAVALQGNGAAITATGGGTITAAGTAIAFMGGTGQNATFDNFAIGNLSGDLVFADPSTATLNFNNTTANAGTNNLLDATAGSAITLNASASALTGAIRTDAASTSNVNLTNGATWNSDRAVDRHQSQRHTQHHCLRSARLGRRLQDADGQQLRRQRREYHHERGSRRIEFGL